MTVAPHVLMISARADVGGGPEHLFRLVESLGTRVEASIAVPREEPYWSRLEALVGPGRMIEIPKRRFTVAALARLARRVRQGRIDLIHSHGKGAGAFSRPLGVITGRPVVHTFHGLHTGDYGAAKRLVYLGIERILGLVTRIGICVSTGEREAVASAALMSESKLRLIENGVIVPQAVQRPPEGDVLRIVTVTRFNRQKNPELLLAIASGLAAQGRDFHLDVLGSGEPEAMAEAHAGAEAAGLARRITWHGNVTDPRPHFRAAHVFLSTARWEGMPLALLEAMSEARLVVATDVVGNRDAVDGGAAGLLYPSEDAAAGIAALLTAQGPEGARLATLGRARVTAHFSVGRMAERTFAEYGRVLG